MKRERSKRRAKCLSLDPELVRQVAIVAAQENRDQSTIVEEALRLWLDERPPPSRLDPKQHRLEVAAR